MDVARRAVGVVAERIQDTAGAVHRTPLGVPEGHDTSEASQIDLNEVS